MITSKTTHKHHKYYEKMAASVSDKEIRTFLKKNKLFPSFIKRKYKQDPFLNNIDSTIFDNKSTSKITYLIDDLCATPVISIGHMIEFISDHKENWRLDSCLTGANVENCCDDLWNEVKEILK